MRSNLLMALALGLLVACGGSNIDPPGYGSGTAAPTPVPTPTQIPTPTAEPTPTGAATATGGQSTASEGTATSTPTAPDHTGSVNDTATPTGDDPTSETVGCVLLDEVDCLSADGCDAAEAYLESAGCGASTGFVGCFSEVLPTPTCEDAYTCGSHPTTGDVYVFTTTCLPSGWTEVTGDACDVACRIR